MTPADLHDLDILAAVSDDQLKVIAAHTDRTALPAGARVLREGDYSPDVLVVLDGEARVERDGQAVGHVRRGDFLGEIGVLGERRRTASVIATTAMRVARLNEFDVRRLDLETLFALRDGGDRREAAAA